MADKEIVNLPKLTGITDNTLFPVYVPGASSPAQSATGAQIRKFAEAAAGNVKKGDKGDTGGVNPNLLDNWYFVKPVNQRGKTNYSGIGYTIDRWKMERSTDVMNLTESGVAVGLEQAPYIVSASQCIEGKNLLGEVLTLSALIDYNNGYIKIEQVTGVLSTTPTIAVGAGFMLEFVYTGSEIKVTFSGCDSYIVTYVAVKLELGDSQTLAHQDESGKWVLNEVPDYGEQLARCQRYQYAPLSNATYAIMAPATAISTTQAVALLPLPVTMRISTPALVVPDKTKLYLQAEGNTYLTNITLSNVANGAGKLVCTVSSGLTVGRAYMLGSATAQTMIIDANL